MGQINSSKEKVLYVGDSHSVVTFGDVFRSNFERDFAIECELYQFAATGSCFEDWMGDNVKRQSIRNLEFQPGHGPIKSEHPLKENLPELISRIEPQEIIFALGTNDIIAIANQKLQWSDLFISFKNLYQLKANFVFFLPPRLSEQIASLKIQKQFQAELREIFKRSVFLTSDDFMPDQSDAVHFQKQLAAVWSERIWSQYKAQKK